ncbi:MAG: hypothetical protein DRJ03_15130 [Chloroflexi bacterium]|nr:MAG: hypothetical protein DRJ03_15130 [Chloroflexota bacterium]
MITQNTKLQKTQYIINNLTGTQAKIALLSISEGNSLEDAITIALTYTDQTPCPHCSNSNPSLLLRLNDHQLKCELCGTIYPY